MVWHYTISHLIHMNHLVKVDYRALMSNLYHNNGPITGALAILGAAILIGVLCIAVDKIRVFAWRPVSKIIEKWSSR